MSRRNKTKFEKWFSYTRHKRRFGATKHLLGIKTNFSTQKKQIISLTNKKQSYTHGSYDNLEKQFSALRKELIGQSELCLTHSKIIVLIRREFKIKHSFMLFEHLWQEEKKFLLKNLNTRWLISAAETFADHSKSDKERAMSIACSCLINTIKVYETERYFTNAHLNRTDKDKVLELQNGRVSLFDGTSAFAVGTDDTLRNMRWRIDKISKNSLSGEILLEAFKRIQNQDTVYKRIKDMHTRKKTGWW